MPINPPFVPDIDLIDRYLAGELSPADAERVHQWTTSRADRDTLVEVLCGYARGVALERMVDVERGVRLLWKSPASAMRPHRERAPYAVERWLGKFSGQILRRSNWYRIAGMVAGVLLLIAGWITVSHRFERRGPSIMATYATGNGQRATIMLTDGNTVTLNVASRLEIPSDYTAGNHTLRLVGEALFTVMHHTGTPFTVLAGPTVTRVLGTSFIVRRYGTDTATMVAVRTGKVAVGTEIVAPQQLVEIGPSGMVHRSPADASPFDFATGVLVLPRMLLSQAIPDLNRWYDADIRLGNATLATKPIEGSVTAGSLADLAERLAVIFDVRVVRDGRILTLYPR